jgi:hypothetical protein
LTDASLADARSLPTSAEDSSTPIEAESPIISDDASADCSMLYGSSLAVRACSDSFESLTWWSVQHAGDEKIVCGTPEPTTYAECWLPWGCGTFDTAVSAACDVSYLCEQSVGQVGGYRVIEANDYVPGHMIRSYYSLVTGELVGHSDEGDGVYRCAGTVLAEWPALNDATSLCLDGGVSCADIE